jgi:hypothetical protein
MKYEKAFVGRLLKQLLVIGILLTFSGCYVPMGSVYYDLKRPLSRRNKATKTV